MAKKKKEQVEENKEVVVEEVKTTPKKEEVNVEDKYTQLLREAKEKEILNRLEKLGGVKPQVFTFDLNEKELKDKFGFKYYLKPTTKQETYSRNDAPYEVKYYNDVVILFDNRDAFTIFNTYFVKEYHYILNKNFKKCKDRLVNKENEIKIASDYIN